MFLTTFMFCSLAYLLELRRNVFGNEEEAVQSQIFVDKTSLVKEFFKSGFTLVTVPEGFGKTTNMDMIRRFCEIQVDEKGSTVPRNETKYFQIFSNLYIKESIQSVLDVFEDKSFFNRFFAQYPIIHMDLTSLSYESWTEFKNSLVKIINELFNYHKYLLSSDTLSDREKILFKNYQFHVICKELQPVQLTESVTYLASLLFKHFNKKVILLIDEIDFVLHESIIRSSNDTEEIITFLADLISNALNSDYTTKGILNSSSRLGRLLIKGVDIIDHFIFTEKHPFNQFYGYTEKEVMNLAGIFKLTNNMTTIRDWYNGYKIPKSNLKIYNFHSIANVFLKKDIDLYSIKGKYPKKFELLFLKREVRRKVKTLINNGVIEVGAIKEVLMEDVLRLKGIFEEPKSTEFYPKDESLLFDYMLNLGYFTVVDYNEHCSKLSLKVPNVESKSELMDLVYSMPYFKTNLTDEEILTVNETLLNDKISKFLKEPAITSSHYL